MDKCDIARWWTPHYLKFQESIDKYCHLYQNAWFLFPRHTDQICDFSFPNASVAIFILCQFFINSHVREYCEIGLLFLFFIHPVPNPPFLLHRIL